MSDKLLQEELSDDLFERLDDSEKNAEKRAVFCSSAVPISE